MESRKIGSLEVSLVGLGCNNFGFRCDEAASLAVIRAALDEGITFFDTADVYGTGRSEEILGIGLRTCREEVIIATKFGAPFGDDPAAGASTRWITQSVEASLRGLRTDRIDLYQQHVPDDAVPIDETLEALDRLVRDGKVREIGSSNVTAEQIDLAATVSDERAWARFVSVQNRCSVLYPEGLDDIGTVCEAHGLVLIPYSPLAGGLLSGKYVRGVPPPKGMRLAELPSERAGEVLSDRNFDLVEALTAFAAARGHTILDLAIGWLVAQPLVASVIAGATSPAQVRANTAAAAWRLSDADLAEVERLRNAI